MSTDTEFKYDVFLSHSAADKDVVRDIANRLKADGVKVWFDEWEIKPSDSTPAKIEDGLEHSRVLVLCLSQAALAADWPQLESHTFRFKDPLNHNRRFIPLRLDTAPIPKALLHDSFMDWFYAHRERTYTKLLDACMNPEAEIESNILPIREQRISPEFMYLRVGPGMGYTLQTFACVFIEDNRKAVVGDYKAIRVWDIENEKDVNVFMEESPFSRMSSIRCISVSRDEQRIVFGAQDGAIRILNLRSWILERTMEGATPDTRTWDPERPTEGHLGDIYALAWSPNEDKVLSGGDDRALRIWDVQSGKCERILKGHTAEVNGVAWNAHNHILSGAYDETIRVWEAQSGRCAATLKPNHGWVRCVVWIEDSNQALFSFNDGVFELWDVLEGQCLHVYEGHTEVVWRMAFSKNQRYVLTASYDGTVRLWDLTTNHCIAVLCMPVHSQPAEVSWSSDELRAFACDQRGVIVEWDLSSLLGDDSISIPRQVLYSNAKVLLVGDSGVGKTGLSKRIATDTFTESESTVGAWCTQWRLSTTVDHHDFEREVWLWDFGGQADQRLIHQLYMDQTQVAALVFDPQKDDCLETLSQWDRDLSRVDKDKDERGKMTKLLVAGRCDTGSLRVARKQVEDFAAERGYAVYLETSAKKDTGCAELKQAIIDGIKWENIPWRSSPVLFKRLKDEIIRLKDEGRVLMRFNELREMLALRMSSGVSFQLADTPDERQAGSLPHERFTDAELKAVIGLLAGPGVVWELEFGSWVLLQPERINAYAQAVIATIREDPHDRGCIAEERVLKGDLTYHASIPRLAADEEQFVLLAMHQILVERGLCRRHQTDTGEMLLTFPSYYRRERRDLVTAPSVVVSYRFNGFLDDVYATLVVKLEHTKEFNHDELWRYAADFKTNDGRQLGVKLTRLAEGEGELDVYFAPDVPLGERIIFSKYIHEHLLHTANDVVRLRHYVCHNEYRGKPCNTTANREVAMERLEEQGQHARIKCQRCEETLELWDDLERQFADPAVKQRIQELRDAVEIVLDTESKERVLVGEVISTVALAGQICREVQVSDWGIDAEVEFKDDDGNATAHRVCLQLKSGDSFLATRKRDGAEIFKSFNQRQAEYWMEQAFPVILIIRSSAGEIRWMEIRDHLKKVTNNGETQVRQIEFDGRRFDVMSVRRWRETALSVERP